MIDKSMKPRTVKPSPGRHDLLIHNVQLATMDPKSPASEDPRYGTIMDGAVLIKEGTIQWAGKETELPENIQAIKTLDGKGQWLTPGLIDCHTHLVYAGDRSGEFEQRLEGVSYETIARQGGGILATVNATRAASEEELLAIARPRIEALMAEGVTTIEIKSGYGLDTQTELKILRAAGKLSEEYPVTITRTFLGAHALPPEYKNRPDEYIELVCNEMLPAIAKEKLADAVDVFCENIAFSVEQTEKVFKKAQELALAVKLHAEQLSDCGGTELAVKYHALSVDHLEYLGPQGIAALKNSLTVATLLPGAFYCLRETRLPPVEQLRAEGILMAIATDLNPGTSPLSSIRLMMNMACTLFRMTPAESLAGCTRNAAKALGLGDKTGMIRAGMAASLVLWPVTHPAAIAADLTGNKPSAIIHNGEITTTTMPVTINPEIWTGRIDNEAIPELSQRWHQKIQGWNPETSSGGVALVGFASDEGVKRNKGRPGAAKGPDAIRKALAPLPWLRKNPAWDAGTIVCNDTQLEQTQSNYAGRLEQVLNKKAMPVGLGGGHEIAWGSYQGLMNYLESQTNDAEPVKLGIINFDAHFDLRLPENGPSSGTPFWQMSEYAKAKGHPYRYMCLGVSHASNTEMLFKRADELGVIYRTDQQMSLLNLDKLSDELQHYMDSVDHIYLTIDMDAFPAEKVPGVSAPAVRGVSLDVVEPLLEAIKASGKLRLIDLAELNPDYDIDNRSAKVAARLVHLLTTE